MMMNNKITATGNVRLLHRVAAVYSVALPYIACEVQTEKKCNQIKHLKT